MGNWKSGRKKDPTSKSALTRQGDESGGNYIVRQDPMWATQEKDDAAFQRFGQQIQGRKGLKALASYSAENPKVAKLLELIDDPRYRTYGIKALARRVGLGYPELVNLFRNKKFSLMFMEFFDAAPDIARDTANAAKAKVDICPACTGFKTLRRVGSMDGKEVIEEIPCPKCEGTGTIIVGGDKDARRDILKAIGVHKDGPMVEVNNNTQINVEGVDDFEELMKSSKSASRIINITPIDVAKED